MGFGEEALVEELDGQGDDGLVGEVEVEGHFGEMDEFFEDLFADLSFKNAREVAIDVDAQDLMVACRYHHRRLLIQEPFSQLDQVIQIHSFIIFQSQ